MSRTILLADDSVTIQKVIGLTFIDDDYRVVAVGNGSDALDKLDEIEPDIVIADVHMPGEVGGYEVARRSKAKRPEVPVVLLVGTFEPFDDDEARASGADEHLKKPFDSQELQNLVESLLARGDDDSASGEPAAPPPASQDPLSLASEDDDDDLAFDLGDLSLDDEDDDSAEVAVPSSPSPSPSPFSIGLGDGNGAAAVEVDPSDGPGAGEDELSLADVEVGGEARVEPPAATDEGAEAEATPETTAEHPRIEPPSPPAAAAPEPSDEAQAAEDDADDSTADSDDEDGSTSLLTDDDIDRIARRLLELGGADAVRDVAWEVVPDLAEVVIRDRLRDLEAQAE